MLEQSTSEFARFLSPNNLHLAWRRIRNSDRLEVKDRLALKIFEARLDIQLDILATKLTNGFTPSDAPRLYTPKKSRTLRPFPFLDIQDRLVYQAIGNIIIENSYSDILEFADRNVFASIPQNPNSDFVLRSSKSIGGRAGQYEKFRDAIMNMRREFQDQEGEAWIVKTDVAAFYPSIDHDVLKQILIDRSWLSDERLVSLLMKCLEVWSRDSHLHFKRGLPIGYETSDVLATLFLLDVDAEMLRHCMMLRYVDDMYLSSTTRSQATRALIELDRLMQQRALILQTAKTDFEELSNSEAEDEHRFELELQERLSLVSVDLDGPPEVVERAQQNLYQLFMQLWHSNPSTIDAHEARFAFILYRLTILDEQLRDIALSLLDRFPSRSIHIAKYLSKFSGDSVVIDKLMEIVRDEDVYSQVRANCMDALRIITSNPRQLKVVARQWCQSDDWYLRLKGIDFLQSDPNEYTFIRRIARQETNPNVLASSLMACYLLTDHPEEKSQIVRECLSANNEFVVNLGLYLWGRETNFVWQDVAPTMELPEVFEPLWRAIGERIPENESSAFHYLVERRLGFELHPDLPLNVIFGNLTYVSQCLIDAYDHRETSPNDFIRSIGLFAQAVSTAMGAATSSLFSDTLYNEVSESVATTLHKIEVAYRRLPAADTSASVLSNMSRPVLRATDIHSLLRDLPHIFALQFRTLHLQYELEMPNTLRFASDRNARPIGTRTFISYKRDNAPFL